MHLELVVAKVVTVLLGGLIAWQAYRGYRVHGSEPLKYVAVGFVFVSVGSVVEGVLFEVGGLSLFEAGAVQTGLVAVGMLFILYSLYGAGSLDDGRSADPVPSRSDDGSGAAATTGEANRPEDADLPGDADPPGGDDTGSTARADADEGGE